MAEVILMPRLSDTMTEGVIAAWHKKVGDSVKKGDLLAEVETDKATMDLESYKDGTLLHIGTEKGGKLQVNDLLAIIGTKGEDISSLIKKGGQASESSEPAKKAEPKKENTSKPTTATKQSAAAEAPAAKPSKSSESATAAAIDISKMEEVVLMPRLSDTMTEGVIAEWHKNVGDKVKKGDILAEIETDKATMELESYKNGTLLHQGAAKGEKIQVNDLLCIIGEKGKVDVDAVVAAAKGGGSSQPAVSNQQPSSESSKAEPQKATAAPATSDEQHSNGNGRMKASPLAKKLAKEKGIDLKSVHGSGDGGRIIKADVDSFSPESTVSSQQAAVSSKQQAGSVQQPVAKFTPTTEEKFTDTPNSQMRKTIARRLGESMFAAPHFYLTMEINMDNAMAARAQMNEFSPVKISFQDMMIKACAMALRQHPAVNSSWMGDFIRTYQHIHIGSAVAVPEGLIVPVIKFADQKSFSQIAAEAKELYGKAKDKKLQPHEFSGNTFTISNLGMMDIEEFTAIINPPDSCILAVGKIKEIVVKKEEGFGVTNVMKVTMSCDHRSVDGAVGAAFLQTVKKFMENPIGMLV
ncbi:MAG TPA: pyruvate dehydrogenase complex dihydrolipoamide acetyltransferase [Chitinophagaceae bacterium]|jgi:pyruvate dehydrogenase E2 component (dihydrolipoamide acetyltransferase)|nr:pyruvate dehydrogenase complex dihydrolipoamide acetyltransferase [Chitinophagaceae bacterium]